ncbi:HD domain-containing protein [Actinophytocola sp.]|uniref:HD domain-containing protein n=1 Tax=Actinophytocola sp. TaxID=1872138 RepID=UPI0039C8AF7C
MGRLRSVSAKFVRSQQVPRRESHPLARIAAFPFESGHLKHFPRSGWLLLGITQPEIVAEHSFRVGLVGIALAALEGADPGRTAALCLMHDVHEAGSAMSLRLDVHTSRRQCRRPLLLTKPRACSMRSPRSFRR